MLVESGYPPGLPICSRYMDQHKKIEQPPEGSKYDIYK